MAGGKYTTYEITAKDKQRFFQKTRLVNGCLEWTGALSTNGYARFWLPACGLQNASRVSYFLTYGELTPRLDVLHSCDNPKCVKPEHLRLGTHHENMLDMVRRYGVGKLTPEDVTEIKDLLSRGRKCERIADLFNVSRYTIYRIRDDKSWRALLTPLPTK